jgi:hypothetical protein
MMSTAMVFPAVSCAAVTTAVWPWFAETVPETSPVGPGLGAGDGAGVGDEGLAESLQPAMVMATPPRTARADCTVKSRRCIF